MSWAVLLIYIISKSLSVTFLITTLLLSHVGVVFPYIWSSSVHLVHLGPFRPIWSTSVRSTHFDAFSPFWSIRSKITLHKINILNLILSLLLMLQFKFLAISLIYIYIFIYIFMYLFLQKNNLHIYNIEKSQSIHQSK